MIINHDMLRNGPLDFEDGAAPKISGQDKNWSTTHNQYGFHNLLGICIYNPEGRVNLINPELLTHDGWSLKVYTDKYGEFAHIFNRKFDNGKTYELEFIRNIEGHLVTFDPSIEANFQKPIMGELKILGNISCLRKFMKDKQDERLLEYECSKRSSDNNYYQQQPSNYNLENDAVTVSDR